MHDILIAIREFILANEFASTTAALICGIFFGTMLRLISFQHTTVPKTTLVRWVAMLHIGMAFAFLVSGAHYAEVLLYWAVYVILPEVYFRVGWHDKCTHIQKTFKVIEGDFLSVHHLKREHLQSLTTSPYHFANFAEAVLTELQIKVNVPPTTRAELVDLITPDIKQHTAGRIQAVGIWPLLVLWRLIKPAVKAVAEFLSTNPSKSFNNLK